VARVAAPPAEPASAAAAAAAAAAKPAAATAGSSRGTVSVVGLGCAKNTVDAETMLGDLQRQGFDVVGDDHASADAIIINSCAFVEDAKNESLEAIVAAAGLEGEDGRRRKVVVTGCLAQRYGEQLAEALPEADLIVGFEHYDGLGASLGQLLDAQRREARDGRPAAAAKGGGGGKKAKAASGAKKAAEVAAAIGLAGGGSSGDAPAAAPPRRVQVGGATVPFRPEAERYRLGPPHSAYLRIAEGCDCACSFCSIPSFRGTFRSKPYAPLLEEARALAAAGVKELCLIAEDTNMYGHDRRDGKGLAHLLRDLSAIDGVAWIRLLYCYPSVWPEELVDEIASNPKCTKSIDIPLQHSDNLTLLAMNRPPAQHTRKVLKMLRERIGPDLALRTTFICGFPGETPEQHRELLDFVRDQRFERMGAFAYSEEEGTPAAGLPGQVPPKERARRRDALVAAQHAIQCEWAEARVGRELDVLIDGVNEDGWLVGRTQWDAPDVDPCVFVGAPVEGSGVAPAVPGELRRCLVTGASLFDLEAHPIA
jgi:ribosomal protein S12 methylthiotransferase